MKKFLSIFICLCLVCPSIYGQSKKSQTKKTSISKTTKKSTSKSNSTKVSSKTSTSNTKKTGARLFEGTLMYASQEYHSAAVRKYSHGLAYNGQREQSITIKGNKAHVIDENLYLHTILDADANICYIYSEVTNTGVSFQLTDYKSFFNQLSTNSKVNKLTWGASGKTSYKGDVLNTYHASISSKVEGTNTIGSVEMWSSSAFKVSNILQDVFYGADTHGLVKKWLWETKSSVPIVGTLHSIVSSELVAISEYNVAPQTFKVPTEITIIPDDISSCKNLNKLHKAHRKALKKKGLTPNETAESTLLKIRSEWSFVQSIEEDERYTGSVGLAVWGEIGHSIITAAATLTKEEIEKRQQERLEEEMTRQIEEQESENNSVSTHYVPRANHTTNARKKQNNTSSTSRSRTIACTDPDLMSEHYIKWMSKTYAEPGTVYDSRLHIKCYNCHKFVGVCTTCNGMGFYKKVYGNVVTDTGIVHNVTSDVPMKGKKRDCGVCGGNGVCKTCKGSGKSPISIMGGSDIKKSCIICHGLKKCKTCDGKGYRTIYTPDKSGQGGIEDESTQSTRKNVEKQVDCGQCGGDGICTHCNGTKLFTFAGITSPCDMCHATGKCYTCKGNKTTSVIARE